MTRTPWYAWLLLWRPHHIQHRLAQLRAAGLLQEDVTLWQIYLGTWYMWHRATYRPETIGLASSPVRGTLRARLLQYRPLRSPFLFAGRRVNPLDHTGLGASKAHLIRHVLGAHHEHTAFDYDLQLLALDPGGLEALHALAVAVCEGRHPQAAFLRDLCVFEGYHETVRDTTAAWLARGGADRPGRAHTDADATLPGFLAWCARQPKTPLETLHALRGAGLDFSPRLT